MTDSTEELTPVLIPFEKSLEAFKKRYDPVEQEMFEEMSQKDLARTRAASHEPHVRERAATGMMAGWKGKPPLPEEEPVIKETPSAPKEPTPEPVTTEVPTEEARSEPEKVAYASAAPKTHGRLYNYLSGDWSNGRGAASTATMEGANSMLGAFDNALKGAREVMNAAVNPGMLGENAGAAILNNLGNDTEQNAGQAMMSAISTDQAYQAAKDADKQAGQTDAQYEDYKARFKQKYQDAMAAAGITDLESDTNTPQQMYEFSQALANGLRDVRRDLLASGADPKVLDDLYKFYEPDMKYAQGKYEHEEITMPKANQAEREATENATLAHETAQAVRDEGDAIWQNTQAIKANMPEYNAILDYMKENHPELVMEHNGETIITDPDMIVDHRGNRINDPSFDGRNARINFSQSNRENLSRMISALEASNDKNKRVMARNLRNGIRKYDQHKAKAMKKLENQEYFNNNLRYNIKWSRLSPTSQKALRKEYADNQRKLNMHIFERYGADAGLSDEQMESFATNGGLASTNLDDYETLKIIHSNMMKEMQKNGHLGALSQLSEKIAAAGGVYNLTSDERELFLKELAFENLSYRVAAMEKMKKLDEGTHVVWKRDKYGNPTAFLSSSNMPITKDQADALHRVRNSAWAEYENGLKMLNEDLEECVFATGDPASAMGYDTKTGQYYRYSPTSVKDGTQADRLLKMILSEQSVESGTPLGDMIKAITDGRFAFAPAPGGKDRRIVSRFNPIFDRMNRANEIIHGLPERIDTTEPATAQSDESLIGEGLAQAIDGLSDHYDVTKPIRGAMTAARYATQNHSAYKINTGFISAYGTGALPSHEHHSAQDLANMEDLIRNIDGVIDEVSKKTLAMSQDDVAALAQYRAMLATNVAREKFAKYDSMTPADLRREVQRMRTAGVDFAQIAQTLRAYSGGTLKGNLSPARILKMFGAIANSVELGDVLQNMALTNTIDPALDSTLGPHRSAYTGAKNFAMTKTELDNGTAAANAMKSPSAMIGLLNAIRLFVPA